MKVKLLAILAAVCVGMAFSVPAAQAARAKKGKAQKQQVTHGELAKLLTRILFLDVRSTNPKDHMKALAENQIQPLGGWPEDPSEVVTKADLAVVIGKTMAQLQGWFVDGSQPPTTAKGWIALLKQKGVPIGSVGQAADNLSPLAQPVQPGQLTPTVDPVETRKLVDLPQGSQYGADIPPDPAPLTIQQVEALITGQPVPAPLPAVTPQ